MTTTVGIAQPDVTLLLDLEGVIREVTVGGTIPGEDVQDWLGRPWGETLGDSAAGDKVKRMLDDARARGISAFRQVTQRFPSGLELPMEYTTVLLGGRAGLLAIGKNLQAVAELQARLIAAQQTMERDYWKLRDVETRYRLLFDVSHEAVLVVRAANLRIAEANPAALRALGLGSQKPESAHGREIIAQAAAQDRDALQAMLQRVREHGKAPGILVHFGSSEKPWMVRASLMTAEPGPLFLLQLAPVDPSQIAPGGDGAISLDEVIEHVPDGFVLLDREGVIHRANRAFLDLIEVGSEGSVIGERLARWLWRPGADMAVLLANVHKHKAVRLFPTTINGELGTETEVEISAAYASDHDLRFVGVLIRNVTRRLTTPADSDRLRSALGSITEQIGKSSLRKLVKETVGVLERHYVKEALELANGNRTAASELLGLSRQSLYTKLNRYGLDNGPEGETNTE
jgi:transcriptional regulator PpsR